MYECLVACDDRPLYDDQLNALIAAIANRTTDLTIVLDCCHSAGATRDALGEPDHGASRFADIGVQPDDAPNPTILVEGQAGHASGARLLQSLNPNYLVVVACQADEKAQEDAVDGTVDHGFFTYGLLNVLGAIAPERRARVRWATSGRVCSMK